MRILSLIILGCLLHSGAAAQQLKRIRLTQPRTRAAVSKIRVIAVLDDRKDTATIGTLRTGLGNKTRPLGLENGAAIAMAELLTRYQNPAPDALPVTVHIRQMAVSEQSLRLKERLTISYNYAFVSENDELAYEGNAYAESNMDVSPLAERLVRESITGTYDKVATAWKSHNSKASAAIAIAVKVEPQPASTGLISYSPDRPLTYEDFKGTPDDLSRGSAATYTGISFAYSAQQTATEFRIMVTVSAIADPEKSWMKASGKSVRVLAHENIHLGITAVTACELADSLRAAVVTKKDYETTLREIFTYFDRKQEQTQRRYDQETGHGVNAAEQAAWDSRIRRELQSIACYRD